MSGERANDSPGLLGRFKRLLDEPAPDQPTAQRASRRVGLPIPVEVRLDGGEPRALRLRDVSLHGFCLDGLSGARAGQVAVLAFEGYPEICPPFEIRAVVVRVGPDPEDAAGLRIDRASTEPNALQDLRKLVLHYLRHRPLLESLAKGFSEVRCADCRWIGRVGERNTTCPRCGGRVRPVTRPPGPA